MGNFSVVIAMKCLRQPEQLKNELTQPWIAFSGLSISCSLPEQDRGSKGNSSSCHCVDGKQHAKVSLKVNQIKSSANKQLFRYAYATTCTVIAWKAVQRPQVNPRKIGWEGGREVT